jgi:hypothetical protein
LHAEWRKHPFRNQEQAMIRLLADGAVERWTRAQRLELSNEHDKLVKAGVFPIPQGIGLSHVRQKPEES